MKLSKSTIAAAFFTTMMFAGTASAFTVSGASSADLNVVINDGVATVFGHVDSLFEQKMAGNAAAEIEGVEEVRNLVTYSN